MKIGQIVTFREPGTDRSIPAIGHVAMLTKTPLGLIGIVIQPLLALAGWEILRIAARRPATTL